MRVLADGLRLPECTAFDADGNLWCAEKIGASLLYWYPNGRTNQIRTGGKPKALVCYEGDLWFCNAEHNTVRRLAVHSETIETIPDQHNRRPLDVLTSLAFDKEGNMIVTCSGLAGNTQGYVVAYSTGGIVEVIAERRLLSISV